ncbi:PREDICTED: receptor-like kinase LIP2 [Amphimedon queenslandica]|uniref:Tyrosine-protein kinase n=1 Tax=Amphimedon queenslandica TaxID=400682 RepID=A0A1X7UI64_AMPQE|nr:PREDICTED: receptor-like kinase LIP2 [Amphimedon queenslandica]|eukprot:XP_019854169.1 PREDICTED: receptor-like kinase LIP2 [Amphimedon queenslandica]
MDDLFKPLEALSLNNVEVTGKELGRGAYGVILEVKVSGLSCAGKKLHNVIAETFLVKNFVQECVNHSQLRHPNIVQLLGVYFPPDSSIPILVMERLQVSLAQYLDDANLPLKVKYDILLDVANGLNYLHNRTPPIIHRDLTAQNILLTKSFSAKISDLGVSKIVDFTRPRSHTLVPGNPIVMPPEAYLPNKTYDFKFDVFSYGCLLLHIFNQDPPVPVNQLPSDPLTEWQRRFSHVARMGRHHPLLPIVKNCLENDPAMRPNMSYIIRVIQATAYTSPDDASSGNYLDDTHERILDKLEKQKLGTQVSYRYKNYDDDFADVTARIKSTEERLSFSCEDIRDAVSSERKESPGNKKIKFNKWNFSLQEAVPGSAPVSRKKIAKKTPDAQENRPQSMMASFTVEKKPPPLPPRVSQNHSSKFTRPSSPLISNHWGVDSGPLPTTHSSCFEIHTPPTPKKFTFSPVLPKKSLAQSMGQPAQTSVYSSPSQCSPTSECSNVSYRERSQNVSGIRTSPHKCAQPLLIKHKSLPSHSVTQSVKHESLCFSHAHENAFGEVTLLPPPSSRKHDGKDDPDSIPISNPKSMELSRNSLTHEWYYHNISNTIAKGILMEREKKNGTFIVGSNSTGEYFLSVYFEKTISHIRIYRDTNGYYSLDTMHLYCDKDKSFASLDELVTFYRMNPLVINGKLIELHY